MGHHKKLHSSFARRSNENWLYDRVAGYDSLNSTSFSINGFWLSVTGGEGAPPKTTFAPLIFSKIIERTIETIAHCFKKTMVYCLLPP